VCARVARSTEAGRVAAHRPPRVRSSTVDHREGEGHQRFTGHGLARQTDPHFARFRELEGIADQVDDDLPHTRSVDHHDGRHGGVDVHGEAQPAVCGALAEK